jgi:4-carboxymuconolactone decarboxylase
VGDNASVRRAGLEKLVEVYGDDLGFAGRLDELTPEGGPMMEETIDHLFAAIWARPGLSVRDRRLVTIGYTASLGRADLLETQMIGALKNGELDAEQLGELVLHLAYYAGWPNATSVQAAANAAVAAVRSDD